MTEDSQKPEKPHNKPGPKTPYDPSLGHSQRVGIPLPAKVRNMIKEWQVGVLLNWMAQDPKNKEKACALVPKKFQKVSKKEPKSDPKASPKSRPEKAPKMVESDQNRGLDHGT